MRSVTGLMQTKLDQALGTDPIYVLLIEWTGGDAWYATRDISIPSGQQCEGRILDVGQISHSIQQDGFASVGSASISLDDSDGLLAKKLETSQAAGIEATLYQFFDGLSAGDLMILMHGRIASPVEWSEGEVVLKIDLETRIRDKLIGFAPISGQVQSEDAVGQPWPLCFGSPLHVPCVRITKPIEDVLALPFQVGVDKTFTVVDASFFPAGLLTLDIDGLLFKGTFNGNVFTIAQSNYPRYQNLALAARLASDADVNESWCAWLSSYADLFESYCLIKDEFKNAVIVQVVRQVGLKLWFGIPLFKSSGAKHLLDASSKIIEIARLPRTEWNLTYAVGTTYDLSIAKVPLPLLPDLKPIYAAGTRIKERHEKTVFVANLSPTSSIRAVYAHRSVQVSKDFVKGIPGPGTQPNGFNIEQSDGQVSRFVAVPTKYYTVNLSATAASKTVATITLPVALDDLNGQGWSDQIYATVTSSIGPNASDIIKWLLEQYSTLSIDAASFAAVQAKVTKYPMHFAYLEQKDVLQACAELAWQARCALLISGGVAKLRFLGTKPSPSDDVIGDPVTGGAEAKVQDKSLHIVEPNLEEITTRFIARWSPYMTKPRKMHRWEEEQVIETNLDLFGKHERSFDFYAYNLKSLVLKAASFWASRMGRLWRRARFGVFLHGLRWEIHDSIELKFASGYVDEWKWQSSPILVEHHRTEGRGRVSVECWLPVESGTKVESANAWQSDASDVTPISPALSLSQSDYDIAVPHRWKTETTIVFQGWGNGAPGLISSILSDATIGDFLIDIHVGGFSPPTAVGVPVRVLDEVLKGVLQVGDRVLVFGKEGNLYITSTGLQFPAVIKAGTNPYSWKRLVLNANGSSFETGNQHTDAYELNGSTAVLAGTKVFMHPAYISNVLRWFFFFPVAECS